MIIAAVGVFLAALWGLLREVKKND